MRTFAITLAMTVGIFFIVGCGTGSSDTTIDDENVTISNEHVKTETDFAVNSSLRADENDIVILNVEPYTALYDENDTDSVGKDCVTYRFDALKTVLLELDDNNSADSITITEAATGLQVAIDDDDVEGDSVPVDLKADTDYTVCLNSETDSNETQTLFARMVENNTTDERSGTCEIRVDLIHWIRLLIIRDCQGCDLYGAYLPSSNFSGSLLSSTDFHNANLSSANLSSANLLGADLSSANLSSANLSSADLSSAKLSSANLSSARLYSTNLSGADLSNATLSNATLSSARLISADLSRATLSGAKLNNADLTHATLSGANLSSAYLSSADLSFARLNSANLSRADLSGANLHFATLVNANLTGADLSGVNLTGADLSGATWYDGETICAEGSIGYCN